MRCMRTMFNPYHIEPRLFFLEISVGPYQLASEEDITQSSIHSLKIQASIPENSYVVPQIIRRTIQCELPM